MEANLYVTPIEFYIMILLSGKSDVSSFPMKERFSEKEMIEALYGLCRRGMVEEECGKFHTAGRTALLFERIHKAPSLVFVLSADCRQPDLTVYSGEPEMVIVENVSNSFGGSYRLIDCRKNSFISYLKDTGKLPAIVISDDDKKELEAYLKPDIREYPDHYFCSSAFLKDTSEGRRILYFERRKNGDTEITGKYAIVRKGVHDFIIAEEERGAYAELLTEGSLMRTLKKCFGGNQDDRCEYHGTGSGEDL